MSGVRGKLRGKYLSTFQDATEGQKNLNVKHNLCYWMSNEPRITTDFYKLQCIPKFTDNQRIADTDMCMNICKHIYVQSFRMLYTVWCLSELSSISIKWMCVCVCVCMYVCMSGHNSGTP
jgi:hypothetical protein